MHLVSGDSSKKKFTIDMESYFRGINNDNYESVITRNRKASMACDLYPA